MSLIYPGEMDDWEDRGMGSGDGISRSGHWGDGGMGKSGKALRWEAVFLFFRNAPNPYFPIRFLN
jgi:hypothetical protein